MDSKLPRKVSEEEEEEEEQEGKSTAISRLHFVGLSALALSLPAPRQNPEMGFTSLLTCVATLVPPGGSR